MDHRVTVYTTIENHKICTRSSPPPSRVDKKQKTLKNSTDLQRKRVYEKDVINDTNKKKVTRRNQTTTPSNVPDYKFTTWSERMDFI